MRIICHKKATRDTKNIGAQRCRVACCVLRVARENGTRSTQHGAAAPQPPAIVGRSLGPGAWPVGARPPVGWPFGCRVPGQGQHGCAEDRRHWAPFEVHVDVQRVLAHREHGAVAKPCSLSHFRSTSRVIVASACLPLITRMYSTVVLVVLNMKLAVVSSKLSVH